MLKFKLFWQAATIFSLVLMFSGNTLLAEPWRRIAKDWEIARLQLYPDTLLTPEILFVRIPQAAFQITTLRTREFGQARMDAKSIASASKALLTINANFFDENGKALGLVMNQGIKYQGIHHGGKTLTGIFALSRNSAQIMHRDNFKFETTIEAIQAGPRLIANNKKITGLKTTNSYSRRAGVCITNNDQIIFFISSGLIGLSVTQLQEMLLNKQINCRDALNLDGGGSAQMFLSGNLPEAEKETLDVFVHGRDPAPVFLAVFPQKK